MAWIGAPGDVRADTIVLKDGETVEGSIVDATRNTVIVRPAIGGMRQMSIRDIQEVRLDLARGQRISGQLLSWADGVYRIRAGDEVIRISEGNVLSREAGEVATGEPSQDLPARPVGQQTVRKAAAGPAAPSLRAPGAARVAPARGPMVGQTPDGQDRSLATDQEEGPAVGEEQSAAADQERSAPARAQQSPPASDEQKLAAASQEQSPPAGDEQKLAAASQEQSPAAGEEQSLAADETKSPAADETKSPAAGEVQTLAADETKTPATGDEQKMAAVAKDQGSGFGTNEGLAVKASVEPAAPGADQMVFRIELSRPAEQTVVLIYGTVDGTAKAGKDFESQQGMVMLAPGSKSAEVRVPLIEDRSSTGEKRFELFLTADPKVAEVVDRRIVATINGGD